MRKLALVLLLTGAAFGQTLPATRPAFTIGKDTTLIEGPLRADGTINYVPAINKLIGGEVKNEANAAIPLLILKDSSRNDQQFDASTKATLETLHAEVPVKPETVVQYFSTYMAHKNGTDKSVPSVEEASRMYELADRVAERPWKRADYPEVAEWLEASAPGLKVIEEACAKPGFYLPFRDVANGTESGSVLDGMPGLELFFVPRSLLLTRAMLRAGEGDVMAALEDLRRVRVLARLAEQEHWGLMHVAGLAVEGAALRGYAGLANSGMLTREQLATVRKEIESLPAFPVKDALRSQVEEMAALDLLMQCIRGRSEWVMRLMAWEFDQTKDIDLGAWANADWDVALQEVVRVYSEEDDPPGRTFAQRMEDLNKKVEQAKADGAPSVMDTIAAAGKYEPLTAQVEAFLKLRPGESRQVFSRRVARWLVGGASSDQRRGICLDERAHTLRVLALAAVSLAEYRLAHGEFPKTLDEMSVAVELDAFSGKPLCYRREGKGYALWSVGMNQKDNGGTKDDIVVKAEK